MNRYLVALKRLPFRPIAACVAMLACCPASGQITPPAFGSATSVNYIRAWDMKYAVTDSGIIAGNLNPAEIRLGIQYFDGLGRVLETVVRQGSPLQKDLVTAHVYDDYGREASAYLPFVSSESSGNFKLNPFQQQNSFYAGYLSGQSQTWFYGQTVYEASPLNRVSAVLPAGNSWIGASRGTGIQYEVNGSNEVRLWTFPSVVTDAPISTAFYGAGELLRNITTDENGKRAVEYRDKQGRVVLKKIEVQTPGPAVIGLHTGWLCTYYLYDDYGNLRCVIQPAGVQLLEAAGWVFDNTSIAGSTIALEQCFFYLYDGKRRMVDKKIPGAGETWMVYDARDRLVMTQDAGLLLQSPAKWMVLEYDSLNRPYRTGLLTDANNAAYHQALANASTSYPNTTANYEVLTQTYYDDYAWAAANNPSASVSPATSAALVAVYNTAPDYAVNPVPYPNARGLVTGSMVKVLGTSAQYLFSLHYYDDHGRVVQTQSTNYTGGKDTMTTQYNFSGLPLRSIVNHQKNGNTAQHHDIITKMSYDAGLRLKAIWKSIDGVTGDKLVDSMQYNELGKLRAKYLGGMDSMIYDYNIRGWLTGINRNFIPGGESHYFGMDLGYDMTVLAGMSYVHPAYNGNIAGTVWKSYGDGAIRKYDFSYDNVNRLTAADFGQYNGTGFDKSAGIDFSVPNISYDANGNITFMKQAGFKLGGSGTIDSLVYSYMNGGASNRLQGVIDGSNDPNSPLGDLHYKTAGKGATDYAYDGNGNLVQDNNKSIDAISYNHLNLPKKIHMNGKGNIYYTYDGAGNKLQKQTVDSLSGKTTTILYLGGIVYQRTSPNSNAGGGIDTLQFLGHEEGRVRWAFHKYLNKSSQYGWEGDFFEKDHLGNTRAVITSQRDSAEYYATMEAINRNTEGQLFYNLSNTGYRRASVGGYPADVSVTNPNDSVARLNGNGPKQGPAIILKVMAGDKVDVLTQYYYNNVTATNDSAIKASDLLNSLATGIATMTGGAHGSLAQLNTTTSPLFGALNSFIGGNNPIPSGKPNAYLNWMLLDDQFRYVGSYPQSGAAIVGAAGTKSSGQLQDPIGYNGIPITKNGYLYIYVSNATKGWDVFFDNMYVKTYSGPLLEENHYYPFGLTMAGISDKALKTGYADNKYKFNNGSELQNKEFSDGSGAELYETPLRSLDPQLGRWWQIDSKPNEMVSPYAAMANNPILYSDPRGDTTWIFGIKGQFLGKVNDKLKNQVHFLDDDNVNAMPFDASKLSAKEAKNLAKAFRSSSVAFMGSNTAGDLKSISDESIALKREVAFVGSIGKDKEIRLTALPVDETNKSNSVDIGKQINANYPEAQQQSELFLFGHVHQYAYTGGYLRGDDHSDMGQLKENADPSYPEDYGPFLKRSASAKTEGPSVGILIAAHYGASIYGGGDVGERVKPSENSYILYKSLK